MLQLLQSVLRFATLCVSQTSPRIFEKFREISEDTWILLGTPEDSLKLSRDRDRSRPETANDRGRGTFAEIEHVTSLIPLILILRAIRFLVDAVECSFASRRYARTDGAVAVLQYVEVEMPRP